MTEPLAGRSHFTHIVCLECQHEFQASPMAEHCPACGGVWLDARYDYEAVARLWQNGPVSASRSLWRFVELLPVDGPNPNISLTEGFTPLVRAVKLQRQFEHPAIFIKDERQLPTSSFKDRQAAVAATAMAAAGLRECVLASTGNAACAYAAYCARADIKLWLFLTSMVPAAKMREAALYGAEVIKITGTYDQAKKIAAEFAARRGIHMDKGAKSIPGKESMKTIAFEIARQLAETIPGRPWRAPDWYIQAVSGGIGPLGVYKGFTELYQMGLIDRVPKIGVVQVDGCSPMVRAFQAGLPQAQPVTPETRITVLSTGDPGMGYQLLYQAIQTHGGHMLSVSDEEAFEAMRGLARLEGISVEPATAVAFAGLGKMFRQGLIGADETVVVNCSGHTFPAEKYITDEESLPSLRLPAEAGRRGAAPLDGIESALQQLDEQVTTIVVIDDNPADSRLIHRLLRTRKNYRIFEANNPVEGLELIRQRMPDLVITDLRMPEMDGFTLLERLKQEPRTAHIPVIVVSGQELTPELRRQLQQKTVSVWLKGASSGKELVEQVLHTLSGGGEREEPAGAETKSTPEAIPAPPKEPAAARRYKIVLVDDNPVDARLIGRMLETIGDVQVTPVYSGLSAVEVIETTRPDLVVLDLVIPDKSGYDILSDLRQNPHLDKIPVVVITAKRLSDAEKQVLEQHHILSLWQKEDLDRHALVSHVETQLKSN